MSTSANTAFVGRERELDQLVAAMDRATEAGRGSLYLVGGEPGIGKSWLADEFAARARQRGVRVFWGRSWEAGGAPAFAPWVQVLRALIRSDIGRSALERMGPAAAPLRAIVPELGEADQTSSTTGGERFRLFDAVTALLRFASDEGPIAIVLDDLNTADTPSLLLLRFVASELARMRVVVIATYRDVSFTPDSSIREVISELVREPASRTLSLSGLAEEDLVRLVDAVAGEPADADLVAAIHRDTDGNPLFASEVVRLLVARGDIARPPAKQLPIPDTMKDAVERRLEVLSDATRSTLAAAAVQGREFTLEVLRRTATLSTKDMLTALEEASDSRIVTDVPAAIGRLRFSHAIVRDTLYESLPRSRAYELHDATARAIEEMHRADLDAHLAEIAHHRLMATPASGALTAASYAIRAASHASRLLAYEEAARLHSAALDTMDTVGLPAPGPRIAALLGLGDAQAKSGDGAASRATFIAAADLAASHGRPAELAQAALGYGGRFSWARAGGDRRLIPLLEKALEALSSEAISSEDGDLRARLLARLAGALRDDPDRSRRWSLSEEAVAAARRLGKASTLSYALESRFASIWEPDTVEERKQIAEEMVELAEDSDDRERELQAHGFRSHIRVELGDVGGARTDLERETLLARELRQPAWAWLTEVARAMFALLEGRYDAADETMREAMEHGRRAQAVDATVSFRLQRYDLLRARADITDAEQEIRASVHEHHWYPMFRCVLADLYARNGRLDDASAIVRDLVADDLASLPVDSQWLFAVATLADAVAMIRDTEAAATLYKRLAPYAALNVYSVPEVATGSAARVLGRLATILRDWEAAESYFAQATAMNDRMGARPWSAWTRVAHAQLLLERGGPTDRRLVSLLSAARETAAQLGMTPLSRRIDELEGSAPDHAPVARYRSIFRPEGNVWEIAYDGRTIRLRDAKGLRYVHRLLQAPGREVHVSDLATPPSADRRHADAADGLEPDPGHGGDRLDPQAKAAYKERIDDLRAQIDEAERWGDPERASRGRAELEFIAHELAAAYGLGGRARREVDVSERIRKAVTNRIRMTIRTIDRLHPALGRHLTNSVRTGLFCSYEPDRPIEWKLDA